MPVMDEFRQEREALKHGTFKQKWQYFLDYYKWYVIGGILLILVVVSLVRDISSHKPAGFYAVFLNSYSMGDEAVLNLKDSLARQMGIDTEEYAVEIDDTMAISVGAYDQSTVTSSQKLMVYVAAGDVDVIAADLPTFDHYATADTFMDLREFLSPDLLAACESSLYYVDMAQVEKQEESNTRGDNPVYQIPDYDHRDPSSMERPAAIGLYVQDCTQLTDAYAFPEGDVILGVVVNTSHPEEASALIRWLFTP